MHRQAELRGIQSSKKKGGCFEKEMRHFDTEASDRKLTKTSPTPALLLLLSPTMKQQITAMDSELERDVCTNHALGQALNDKTHKIDNLNLELQKSRRLVAEKERLISLFVTDLDKLVSEIDPAYWRDAVRQLYRTFDL
jgi:hypothetical protein